MNPSEVALTLEQAKRLAELDPKHFNLFGPCFYFDMPEGIEVDLAAFREDGTPIEMARYVLHQSAMYRWMLSQMADRWNYLKERSSKPSTRVPSCRVEYNAMLPAMKSEGHQLASESGSKIILESYIAYLEARSAGGSK